MSAARDPRAHAAHLGEEELLELALALEAGRLGATPVPADADGVLAGRRVEVEGCAACAAALHGAREELRALRAAALELDRVADPRNEHTVELVLAATTREDLTWRGDWRVVGRFLGERMRRSRAVRLLAASLLVHVLALPVIAWVLLARAHDEARVVLTFDLPEQLEPAAPPPTLEPRRELVREPMPETPGPSSYAIELPAGGTALEEARRALLAAGTPPSTEGSAGAPRRPPEATASAAGRLLEARSRRLALGVLERGLQAPSERAPLVLRALWAELLLDDWTLAGRPDPRLARALQGLVSARAEGSGPASNAALDLARRALERAAAQGAVIPGAALGTEPQAALSRGWFESLETALADAVAQDPEGVIAGWIAWGRRNAR